MISTGISAVSTIPYVEIINCCDSSDRGLFNIEGFNPSTFQNGVYNYTGPGFVTTQMTFVTGNCYTIVYPGNSGTTYFPISIAQWADFNLTSTDLDKGCLECIDCNPAPLTKLIYTSCCGQSVIQTQGALPFGITQLIIKYTGPLTNGFDNKCYVVTQQSNISAQEYATLPPQIVSGTYIIVSNNPNKVCADYPVPECPACQDPQCYTLINCDGVYFNTWEDLSDYVGDYILLQDQPGVWFVTLNSGTCNNAVLSVNVIGLALEPCDCKCYEVTGTLKSLIYINCDNEIIKDATATKFCSRVYPIFSGQAGQFQIIQKDLCVEGLCPIQCYKLTNCDSEETIYSTLQSLSQYVNTNSVVSLLGYSGCWKVQESIDPDCNCLTVTIATSQLATDSVANVAGTFNGKNFYTFQIGTDTYYIAFDGEWRITLDALPPTGIEYARLKSDLDCPEAISDGTSTGWIITNEIWTQLQTEKCPGECNCPVDITVLQVYDGCKECLPYIAYRLQNCKNSFEVQYTIQDLSDYVDQVIETDCACWLVEEINYQPPSLTLVTVDYSFKTCTDCLSTFYRLTDCQNIENDIVTKTDLSSYVGQFIKIENCDTCWEVSTTRTFTELLNVVVVEGFETCEDCGIPTVCECTQVTNTTLVDQTYCYLDCDFNKQSVTLKPGETSDKICVIDWIACPSNDCNCLTLEFGLINVDNEEIYNFKLEKTTLIKNGKPVYKGVILSENSNIWEFTLSYEFDNCWYSFFTTGGSNDAGVPSFILCEDIDCPIGEWTLSECACINVTFTTDSLSIDTSLFLTSIDENNNYVYQDGGGEGSDYEISYNVLLGRWEFKDYQTDELLAYYVTSSKCPYTGTTEPISWTVVNVSNTFSVDGFCTFHEQEITFNTTQCLQECECINMTLTINDKDNDLALYAILQPTGNIVNGKPEYIYNIVEGSLIIQWDSTENCWLLKENDNIVVTLCNSLNVNCPIGTWLSTDVGIINAVSEFCTDETTTVGTTTLPEYIQNFGSCIYGVCPQPVFKNNRTVRPGYNTPICTPAKYDEITCKFADILYKIVLEKRYGITNCCPDEDDKWLVKKELIDLQALKDPNYNCPDCPCSCNSGKTCSTCNCKK